MIREYLLRLQALQLNLFSNGNVNLDVQIRKHLPSGEPWLSVTVSVERPTAEEEFVNHHELFDYYDFQTPDENFKRLENKYNTIEEFINTHKK